MKITLTAIFLAFLASAIAVHGQGTPPTVAKATHQGFLASRRGPDVPIVVPPAAHLPSPKWSQRAAQGHGGASNGLLSD